MALVLFLGFQHFNINLYYSCCLFVFFFLLPLSSNNVYINDSIYNAICSVFAKITIFGVKWFLEKLKHNPKWS